MPEPYLLILPDGDCRPFVGVTIDDEDDGYVVAYRTDTQRYEWRNATIRRNTERRTIILFSDQPPRITPLL